MASRAPHQDGRHVGAIIPTSVLDRVLLELSERSAQRSHLHIGGVMLVKGAPPTLAELRRLVTERAHHAPVLGYRLRADRRCWEPDPGFTPADHVQERRLSPGADVVAEALAVIDEPLPSGRPLWRLVLLRGSGPGTSDQTPAPEADQFAVCYCAHHAFQDGMAIAATLEALFGTRNLPTPARGETRTAARPWRWPAPANLAVPVRPTAIWTPARRPTTGQRRLLPFHLDQPALRAISQAAGVTRNHVCLATLAAALREWTPADWTEPLDRRARKGLRVAVPLDLRAKNGGGCLGNQVGVMSVELPCHLASPRQHLEHVVAQTQPRRIMRHRELYRTLAPHLPRRLTRAMYLRHADTRYIGMLVTTVRVRDLEVGGTPAHDVFAIPPTVPGQPMTIALLQYRQQVFPSLIVDTAVPDPHQLADLWQKAVSHLHDQTCTPPG
ncbi:wax ester/triacylglycerol synthase domain-containing protein [Actinomadura kijaniata]|uniref:wax ester/triacylglycerol synthase domain-containing protein n=1 Tax=Actinomadura kijaniata TaxID=46161 RepID=UPI003F1BA798